MKLFAAGIVTETNTFSPLPTGLKDFEMVRPDMITDEQGYDSLAEIIGVFEKGARARGWDFDFGLYGFAQPAGTTLKSAYETLRDEMLDRLREAMPVDVVVLVPHGAMVAQGYDDCEEDMVLRIREIVGDDAIIGVELDLHCHLTQKFVDTSDVVVIFKEYPHTDILDRAHDLMQLVADTAEGKIKPTMALYDCKMVGMYLTPFEPMRSFVDSMFEAEGKDGVLSLSLGHCFPWGDVPQLGTKMLAVTDDDAAQAVQVAEAFGKRFFEMRHTVNSKPTPLDEALDKAMAIEARPVVMADVTDNAGGGAPSDSTFALRAMLERGITDAAIGMFWDPVVVQVVMSAEVGDQLDIRLGGKMGPASGDPLDITVDVIGMIPDMYQIWPQDNGEPMRMATGDAVALHCQGIDIVVNSKRGQVFHPSVFTNFGIDVMSKRLLVVKSTQHFYAGFSPIASEVLYMSAPGALQMDYAQLPYQKADTHKYPWIDNPFNG